MQLTFFINWSPVAVNDDAVHLDIKVNFGPVLMKIKKPSGVKLFSAAKDPSQALSNMLYGVFAMK